MTLPAVVGWPPAVSVTVGSVIVVISAKPCWETPPTFVKSPPIASTPLLPVTEKTPSVPLALGCHGSIAPVWAFTASRCSRGVVERQLLVPCTRPQ